MQTMASRSPSPNPSRASNPNPRTPDSRRNSYSKPSNPNSDGHQRNFGKTGGVAPAAGSPRASFELKENSVGRSRSPAMSSSSKGAKNFMSPTISASSKVTAASPRRKVLGERNEATVRTSHTSLPAAPPAADEAPVKPDTDPGVPHAPRETEQMPKHSSDPETKCQCSDALEAPVAPLDADPRLPPYDPETNYLSPRPRFLHYRPNPRIESSVHCERDILQTYDGRRLDDSFSSEVYEESSVLSEEEPSFNPDKEQSPDSKEDVEAQSFEPQEDGEKQIPDPLEDYDEQSSDEQSNCEEETSFPVANIVPEQAAIPSGVTKGSTPLWYKFASILLVSVMVSLLAFFCGTSLVSPSPSMLNAPLLQVVNDIHIREHVFNSAVHLKELTSRLRHLSFGIFGQYGALDTLPEFGPFYAANLTASSPTDQEVAIDVSNRWMAQCPGRAVEGIEMEQSYWGPVDEERSKTDGLEIEAKDAEILDGESGREPEMDDPSDVLQHAGVVEEESLQKSDMERQPEVDVVSVDVLQDAEILEEVNVQEDPDGLELHEEMDVSGDVQGERTEVENVVAEVGKEQDLSYGHESKYEEAVEGQEDGTATSDSDSSYPGSIDDDHGISNGFDLRDLFAHAYDSKPSNKLLLGISSAVLLLSACLIFLNRRQKKMPVVSDASKTPPPEKLMAKELVSGSSNSYIQTSDSPHQNSPVDMMLVDDSGPSESSTGLQQSRSVGRRRSSRVSDDENSNFERQTRRESTVSSSSISYGSYTTFEKLSAKKGPKEEEVMMTPVRRSSRIRNQIVSP